MNGWSVFALLVTIGLVRSEETCLSGKPENHYFLLGPKTAYEIGANANSVPRAYEVFGCQPTAFWLLNRPGSQNPEADEIHDLQQLVNFKSNIVNNYKRLESRKESNYRSSDQVMCNSDFKMIENWELSNHLNVTFAGNLTTSGYMITQQKTQTWKSRFPGVLTDNRNDYLFKFGDDRLSRTTFDAFIEGLFRTQVVDGYGIPKEIDEKLVKPYRSCPAWKREVEDNSETFRQRRIFEGKLEFREMITNISRRLGFVDYDIDNATVYRMYEMCRYEKSWKVENISPWCAAFSREDLKRLEYAEDLEAYYKYGYGNPVNKKVACASIRDMMNFFYKHVNNELPQQPRAQIQFTNAGTILMALTALGAQRDSVPLTGDNYHNAQIQSRRWTTSTMTPFNANLASVLYKCDHRGNYQMTEQYQVLFLLNEHPLYLEECKVGLCNWSSVRARYDEMAAKCDQNICSDATRVTNGLLFLVFSLGTMLLVFTL